MQEARLIEINLDSSLDNLHEVGTRSPLHQFGISMSRHHQSDIHSCQSGCSHGKEHGFGRQEIWTFHIHIAMCLKQDAHIPLHDVRPWRNRTAGHDLRQTVVGDTLVDGGIISAVRDELPTHKIPIHQKCPLDRIYGTAPDTKVGISPSLLLGALDIAQGYVHATDETHFSINHAEFAVIAIIHLSRERRKTNRHESLNENTSSTHAIEEAVFHFPAPHIVIDQSHLDSLLGFVNQGIGHQVAQRILLDDIHIQMNMILGLSYII